MLNIVSQVCFENKISFKYIKSNYEFRKNISEEESPSSLGKYITIYPESENNAFYIMDTLKILLKDTDGPYIISDFKYKNANNIFFRYGINTVSDITDFSQFTLYGPNGQEEQDIPHLSPYIPTWINIPKGWVSENEYSLLIDKYEPYEILSQNSTGNIYIGKDNNNKVIIKEAKLGTLKNGGFDTFSMRQNEWENMNSAAYFPKKIEKIIEISSVFYIYEYIDGITFDTFLSKNNFMLHTNKSKIIFDNVKDILDRIFNIIIMLHSDGKTNIDIHARNFMIDKSGNVFIIDAETINYKTYDIRSTGFWYESMKQMSVYQKDTVRLYLLVIYALGRQNYFLDMVSFFDIQKITYRYLSSILNIEELKYLTKLDQYQMTVKDIKSNVSSLKFKGYTFKRCKTFEPKFDVHKTFEMLNYNVKKNNIPCIGIQGIASEIMQINIIKKYDKNKYEKILNYLRSLIFINDGLIFLIESEIKQIINPYVSRGIAGLLLSMTTVPKELIPSYIISTAYSVAIPYAKSSDYDHGLLGIADAVLSIAAIIDDELLFGRGLRMLEACRFSIINTTEKTFIPVLKSNLELCNTLVDPLLALNIIENKWGKHYETNI
ncbi:class III lanthionine synthetase LanKC N-terminal domain-containing protein [Periweissella fabalis]|uniref:RamC N-terminal domain-containing protein n=1 Tax=Periweissella fabalis TaxID=1070421 RepID=A0A7X6S3F3_9LACO|nr:hypothetical protein [Periweissella fabalis]MCM0598445.1 hypothetical protein [Periweissella fabalis]NKZ25010.1 hypothetical protein [Periweissella fabalis]